MCEERNLRIIVVGLLLTPILAYPCDLCSASRALYHVASWSRHMAMRWSAVKHMRLVRVVTTVSYSALNSNIPYSEFDAKQS